MKVRILALLSLFLSSCTVENNINISEYPIITTAKELADYYYLRLDTTGNHEKTSITRHFDGSSELEYTYDLLETTKYDPLYYSIVIVQERNLKGAKATYTMYKGLSKLIENFPQEGLMEIDSLNLPGNQAYYAITTYENEPNGLAFAVRKGTRVYSLTISGIYTDDHSLLLDLILPKIENLKSFNLKK